jgi:hypothetical protein
MALILNNQIYYDYRSFMMIIAGLDLDLSYDVIIGDVLSITIEVGLLESVQLLKVCLSLESVLLIKLTV